MLTAGFVTGLAAECRVLGRALRGHAPDINARIACAGADAGRAAGEAERLLAQGAGALVSFGIAGGLDPALRPGDLVVPDYVLLPDGRSLATAAHWRRRLGAAAGPAGLAVTGGLLAGRDAMLCGTAEKRTLFQSAGARAVDMESHAVASVAAAAGVPFLVLRAVADPAGRAVPRAVVGSVMPDGRPSAGLVAWRLAFRPWEVPQVNRLRGDVRIALRALERVTQALGPALLEVEGGG